MRFCVLGIKAGGGPLLERSSAAVVLSLDGTNLLFDCAEGTQHQLIRAKISRNSIDRIFISHMHGDHVLGLMPLLSSMSSDQRKKALELYGPCGIEEFVRKNAELCGINFCFTIVIRELEEGFCGELVSSEKFTVSAAMLEHILPDFGYRVESVPEKNIDREKIRSLGIEPGRLVGELKKKGRISYGGKEIFLEDVLQPPRAPVSFVFTGDTRYCRQTLSLAQNADLLIHEATFDSSYRDNAAEWYHSTARDAALVAAEAGVKRLFLTHFSNRYGDLGLLLDQAREIFPGTYLAEELQFVEV